MTSRIVFLVPGFFGFTSVGAVSYFEQGGQALGDGLRRHGVDARVVRCRTQPTASIPLRADHLDVVGHDTLAVTRSANWLPSGAGITPAGFAATWDAVAAAIARSRRRPPRKTSVRRGARTRQ